MKENSDANNFQKWKEAIVSAFKVMEKEFKLQHNLDCSGSGTTAVVIIKQVKKLPETHFLLNTLVKITSFSKLMMFYLDSIIICNQF